jgi:hypothetical protein
MTSSSSPSLIVAYVIDSEYVSSRRPNAVCIGLETDTFQKEILLLDIISFLPHDIGKSFIVTAHSDLPSLLTSRGGLKLSSTSVVPLAVQNDNRALCYLRLQSLFSPNVIPVKQALAFCDTSRYYWYSSHDYDKASEQSYQTCFSPFPQNAVPQFNRFKSRRLLVNTSMGDDSADTSVLRIESTKFLREVPLTRPSLNSGQIRRYPTTGTLRAAATILAYLLVLTTEKEKKTQDSKLSL